MAAIDWTKPVEARYCTFGQQEWRSARVLCTDRKGLWPVVLLVDDTNDNQCVCYAKSDGSCDASWQFRNVPPKPVKFEFTRWVNVYREPSGRIWFGDVRESLEDAEAFRGRTTQSVTVPVTIRGEWPQESSDG